MATTIGHTVQRFKNMTFYEAGLACPDATTPVLMTLYPEGNFERMTVCITETANNVNLDAFAVEYLFHADGTWVTVASAAADYTTPNVPVAAASGDLTALVKNTSGWCILDIRGAYGVRFSASGNLGAAAVTISGHAQ